MLIPRLTVELPGSGGTLSRDPADFVVTEHLPYAANGAGEHVFLEIEKIDLTTPEAALRLQKALGLGEGSWAGMKDRAAIARQWLSFALPIKAPMPELIALDGVRVLRAIRHEHKLRRGHVRANQFAITLRHVPPGGIERATAILDLIRRTGAPNTFGPQRFGRAGDNAVRALEFVQGKARPPRDRRFRDLMISALQSEIFNRVLALRIAEGSFASALLGDVMQKHETGGLFEVADAGVEQARVDRLEISPTAPLPGKKYRRATGPARAIEERAMEAIGVTEEELSGFAEGTRRTLRYPLDEEAKIVAVAGDVYRLEVTLPSGAYATVLLDELVKPEGAPFDREA